MNQAKKWPSYPWEEHLIKVEEFDLLESQIETILSDACKDLGCRETMTGNGQDYLGASTRRTVDTCARTGWSRARSRTATFRSGTQMATRRSGASRRIPPCAGSSALHVTRAPFRSISWVRSDDSDTESRPRTDDRRIRSNS